MRRSVCIAILRCEYQAKGNDKYDPTIHDHFRWVEHCGGMPFSQSFNHSTSRKMFTVEQIKAAHSKVKSGADFPAYIQDIKKLGVTYYETFVRDGHTDYYGENTYKTTSPAWYEPLVIAETLQSEQFKRDLKEHQQGKTDYPTFIKTCADLGVGKWLVCIKKMTCTYYDLAGNEILVEQIPQ